MGVDSYGAGIFFLLREDPSFMKGFFMQGNKQVVMKVVFLKVCKNSQWKSTMEVHPHTSVTLEKVKVNPRSLFEQSWSWMGSWT